MSFTELTDKVERLLIKIHQRAPHDELYMEALPLLKELCILEHRNKSNENLTTKKYDTTTEAHISKAQRKLIKWARDPEGMPSKILDSYRYLSAVRKESFIDVSLFEKTFKLAQEDVDSFRRNFDQMKNFAEKNHAKIFDIQPNGNIIIWPPVNQYVESYWDIAAIRDMPAAFK